MLNFSKAIMPRPDPCLGTWGVGYWHPDRCTWVHQVLCRSESLLPTKIKWLLTHKTTSIQSHFYPTPTPCLGSIPPTLLATRSIVRVKSQKTWLGKCWTYRNRKGTIPQKSHKTSPRYISPSWDSMHGTWSWRCGIKVRVKHKGG